MKNKLNSLLCVAVFTLLFSAACTSTAPQEKPAAFDLTAAKKLIDERDRVFMDALSKGDSVGVANCYTVDAKFMEPGAPATAGRSNIQSLHAKLINTGLTRLTLTTTELWGDENMLVGEGTWSFSDKDGKQLDHGKQIEVYKMENGTWKIFRDCFNSNLPTHSH